MTSMISQKPMICRGILDLDELNENMNSSHNGKYFMISYAISEVRFNDIDDFAKTYDLSRHIRPRCVTQEAITYYL